jgi:Domain of unknown function (DUF4267)
VVPGSQGGPTMVDETSADVTGTRYWGTAAVWLAAVASAAILLLGLRAFVDPVSASAAFGLPMHTGSETTFVRIYGARNAFLGVVSLRLLWLRMTRPVALLFTVATVLPLLDAWVIVSRIGVGAELVRHAVILLVLVVTSTSLRRLDSAASAGARRAPGAGMLHCGTTLAAAPDDAARR